MLSYLNKLIFHSLEDLSRYRDPQLQVGANYSYLINLTPNTGYLNTSFIPSNSDLMS